MPTVRPRHSPPRSAPACASCSASAVAAVNASSSCEPCAYGSAQMATAPRACATARVRRAPTTSTSRLRGSRCARVTPGFTCTTCQARCSAAGVRWARSSPSAACSGARRVPRDTRGRLPAQAPRCACRCRASLPWAWSSTRRRRDACARRVPRCLRLSEATRRACYASRARGAVCRRGTRRVCTARPAAPGSRPRAAAQCPRSCACVETAPFSRTPPPYRARAPVRARPPRRVRAARRRPPPRRARAAYASRRARRARAAFLPTPRARIQCASSARLAQDTREAVCACRAPRAPTGLTLRKTAAAFRARHGRTRFPAPHSALRTARVER